MNKKEKAKIEQMESWEIAALINNCVEILLRRGRPSKIVNAPQLAKILGVHQTTVRREAYQNKIPHFYLGNSLRFREEEVITYLEEKTKRRKKKTHR